MMSSRIIEFHMDGQVASDSSSLPDPVALEIEEKQLDTVGDYECPPGMSVESVPEVMNIKVLKMVLIAHNWVLLAVEKQKTLIRILVLLVDSVQ